MYDKWHDLTRNQKSKPVEYDYHKEFTEEIIHSPSVKKNISQPAKNDEDGFQQDIVDQYLKDIRHIPLLSKEEEIYYARLAQQGDAAARHKMIESNLRLVVKIARRYLKSDMHILDLIEEGNLGLMHSVEKFDPEKGFRFSTYSAWWIQQNIERAIMNQSRTVRVPVHVVKKINTCFRVKKELAQSLEYTPTAKDVAKVMEKSTDDVERMLLLSEKALSIDSPTSEYFDKTLLDSMKDENADDPLNAFLADSLIEQIHAWVEHLPAKHREVLIKRFGLYGQEPKTLDQTGLEVGLTRERIRQLQTEGLKLLKSYIESDGESKRSLLI